VELESSNALPFRQGFFTDQMTIMNDSYRVINVPQTHQYGILDTI